MSRNSPTEKPTVICLVDLISETEKAVCFRMVEQDARLGPGYFGTPKKSWIPKSCVTSWRLIEGDSIYEVEIAEWVAKKNNFLPPESIS